MSISAAPAAPPAVLFRRLAEHRPPVRPHALRLVAAPAGTVSSSTAPTAPAPPCRAELHRMLAAVLEILDGRRPARQLDELLPVSRQHTLLGAGRRLPAVAGSARRLCSVHPARIATGVLEVCGTVVRGDRAGAVVARMELTGGRWRFTLITLV